NAATTLTTAASVSAALVARLTIRPTSRVAWPSANSTPGRRSVYGHKSGTVHYSDETHPAYVAPAEAAKHPGAIRHRVDDRLYASAGLDFPVCAGRHSKHDDRCCRHRNCRLPDGRLLLCPVAALRGQPEVGEDAGRRCGEGCMGGTQG